MFSQNTLKEPLKGFTHHAESNSLSDIDNFSADPIINGFYAAAAATYWLSSLPIQWLGTKTGKRGLVGGGWGGGSAINHKLFYIIARAEKLFLVIFQCSDVFLSVGGFALDRALNLLRDKS